MKDLFPDQTRKYQFVEKQFAQVCEKYGFEEVRTPIMEHRDVFRATLGTSSDVVSKQMYTFDDFGTPVVLRPENTASVMRAFTKRGFQAARTNAKGKEETGVTGQSDYYLDRLYYFGPMFRRERPQTGRLRQFEQFGIECLVSDHPLDDAQCIAMAYECLSAIQLQSHVDLHINTIGEQPDRDRYKALLLKYFEPFAQSKLLSNESLHRYEEGHVFRIIDSKELADILIVKGLNATEKAVQSISKSQPEMVAQFESLLNRYRSAGLRVPSDSAPTILECLSNESEQRHNQVLASLDALKVPYVSDPLLFRGLDYYSHSTFEFISRTKQGLAQSAVLAGGRYVGLGARFGSSFKSVSAVGWAAGVDRLVLELETNKIWPVKTCKPLSIAVVSIPAKDVKPEGASMSGSPKILGALSNTPLLKSSDSELTEWLEGVTNAAQSPQSNPSSLRSIQRNPEVYALHVAQLLRSSTNARVIFQPALSFRQQLASGSDLGCQFAIIVGPDEANFDRIIVRNLASRQQQTVDVDELLRQLRLNV